MASVARAGLLQRDSADPAIASMGYVYLRGEADIDQVLQALNARPDVEIAEPAAKRTL